MLIIYGHTNPNGIMMLCIMGDYKIKHLLLEPNGYFYLENGLSFRYYTDEILDENVMVPRLCFYEMFNVNNVKYTLDNDEFCMSDIIMIDGDCTSLVHVTQDLFNIEYSIDT